MNPQLLFLLNAPENRMLFNLDAQLVADMIPVLVNFVLLVVVMSWLLYKPVRKILAARAERVFNELNEAEAKNTEAQELKTQYEAKVKEIESERASILEEARKQAQQRREQIIEEAKAEAQDAKDRAARDIANEREMIKDAVCEAIIDISADMAAKLISATIDKSAHDKLFAEAMAELEATAFRTNAANSSAVSA